MMINLINYSLSFQFINKRQLSIILSLLLIFIVTLSVAISIGSFKLSILDYFAGNLSQLHQKVLLHIRAPRVLLAALVGASLSLSGACLQGLFRNPLADPGLIGVSSGAALGAALTIVLGAKIIPSYIFGPYILPFSAIVGSATVIILLFAFTKGFGVKSMIYMLLVGIAVNAFAGVGIGILTYISSESELRSLTFWTMGSFGGVTWDLILPAALTIFFAFLWTFRISRKLDLLQLGESEAYSLGVNIKRLRFDIIISSAIIVGISVSLSGMIGFVGLIVPHLARLFGGVNHNYLLPASILTGAIIMIFADLLSRILIQPAELPVGLITSAIGSPFFLWLIFNMRKK